LTTTNPTRVAPLGRDGEARARDSETRVARYSETGTGTVTPTKTVIKQKDPKRVEMGRQLGLRSKEYKLKKQEMMKSEKEDKLNAPTSDTSSSKTMIIGVTLVGALGLGYFVYTKFKSSLHLPTLTPAIIEQRESFEQETRRRETIPSPSKIPKLTQIVDME